MVKEDGKVRARMTKLIRRTALLLVVITVGLLASASTIRNAVPPLEPWHTFVPHEMKAKASITPIGRIISRPKTRFSRR